jgi:hypothetical protein
MRRPATIVLWVVILTGTAACKVSDPTTGVQFFPTVYSDFIAAEPLRVATPATQIIRDQATWDAFWQMHGPLGQAPAVDFSQDMLIGVFWGDRGSGCFNFVNAIMSVRVRIDGINTTGVIEVDIGPLPDLGLCAAPVRPLQVILLDTTIAPVEFVGMVPS